MTLHASVIKNHTKGLKIMDDQCYLVFGVRLIFIVKLDIVLNVGGGGGPVGVAGRLDDR